MEKQNVWKFLSIFIFVLFSYRSGAHWHRVNSSDPGKQTTHARTRMHSRALSASFFHFLFSFLFQF